MLDKISALSNCSLIIIPIKFIKQRFKMEMILNENDIVVGASFENGTIQDYVNEERTYGLVRIDDSSANWFLFNKEDSDDDLQTLYSTVILGEHKIQDDFGEEIVVFNKTGNVSFDVFVKKIDEYLNDEMGNLF